MISRTHYWQPPTDVYESDKEITIRMEIAGMRVEDFDIHLERNVLTISGVRQDSSVQDVFRQIEIRYGEFLTQVEIGHAIDSTNAHASYHEGFLVLSLPKVQPTKVDIKTIKTI